MPKTVNYIFLIYSEKKAHEGILCDADRGLLNDINGFTYVLTVDFPITFRLHWVVVRHRSGLKIYCSLFFNNSVEMEEKILFWLF